VDRKGTAKGRILARDIGYSMCTCTSSYRGHTLFHWGYIDIYLLSLGCEAGIVGCRGFRPTNLKRTRLAKSLARLVNEDPILICRTV